MAMETTRGLPGNVASHHEHDAELAHRVREGQHTGGEEPASGLRDGDGKEGIERSGTQAGRGFHGRVSHGRERAMQRLHHERQGIDHRGDHEARERERQRAAGDLHPEGSDRRAGVQEYQQVEAEHRGRQDQGECGERLDRRSDRASRGGDPPGERRSEYEQDQGRDGRQVQRHTDRTEFHYPGASGARGTLGAGRR